MPPLSSQGLLITGIGLVLLMFSRIFMDRIWVARTPVVGPALGALAVTLVFQFLVSAIQALYWLKIEGKLAIEANASFMWHVLRLPVGFCAAFRW